MQGYHGSLGPEVGFLFWEATSPDLPLSHTVKLVAAPRLLLQGSSQQGPGVQH